MSILLKQTYKFNTVFVEMSVSFFKEIEKTLNIATEAPGTWGHRRSQTGKENDAGGIINMT